MRYKKATFFLLLLFLMNTAYADTDPATSAVTQMHSILFGALGVSLCGILLGATFLIAKAGKTSWDRFVVMVVLTAGFLSTPLIVSIIGAWVRR